MLPTCFPIFGSCLHSSRLKGCVRKIEITRVTSPQFSRYTVQEFLFGRGKSELNSDSNSLSVSQRQEGLLPNKRDGTSEIAFLLPAIWMGVRGHARCIFRRNARACMRFSAIFERRDPRRATQPIDGELSLNSAIRFLVSELQIPSMTNHKMSRPAISKSEFEMHPPGLSNVTIWLRISSGHCHLNTVGIHSESSPTTTPPTPWLDASTIPM